MTMQGPPSRPSPIETPAVWRAPSGLRGLASKIGIGHLLEAEVDGRKWHLDETGRAGCYKLLIDGQETAEIATWPRAWIDTVALRHLERELPDRRIDGRKPIDVAGSSHGATLVVADEASLVVHDLDRRIARTVSVLGPSARVHAVAVDPSGVRVAAGYGHYIEDFSEVDNQAGWTDGTVRVFRVMDGALEAELHAATERVHAVAFTADGDRVVSACGPEVRVHRAWDQALETTLLRRNEEDVAFSPRGNTFVTLEARTDIALWEITGGGARRSVVLGEHPQATALAFGMGGAILATGNHEDVRIWDLRTLSLYATFPRPAETTALAFTPRGDALLCAGWTHADPYQRKPLLSLVDARDGRPLVELHGHIDAPNAVAIDPRGQLAASASFEGPVRIWRLADGACIRTLDAKAFPPARLAFVDGGAELVLLSDQLTRWKVDDGARIERQPTRSGAPWGGDVAKRKDGTRVGLSRAGALVEYPPGANLPARNRGVLDITADGTLVAKTVERGDLVVSETREGKELPMHAPSSTGASVLATCPDGIHYATGDTAAARVYRLGATEPSAVYPCTAVTALAFGGERGTWLAIGKDDGTLEVRDIASGSVLANIDLRGGHVRSLAFRGDGRVLAVATARTVRLLLTSEWHEIAGWDARVIEDPLRVAWSAFRLVVADKRGCLVFEYPDERR
jgi:WD40 repeat protein